MTEDNSHDNYKITIKEQDNALIVSKSKDGVVVDVVRFVAGSITQAQIMYYEVNLRGRISQVEADLILKYFYGINIEE